MKKLIALAIAVISICLSSCGGGGGQLTIGSTTLTTSVANLALAVSGSSRVVTVTNNGTTIASNLSLAISPALPSGTTSVSTCTTALNPSSSCTVTITPGATPTSAAGTAPVPSVLTFNSLTAGSATVKVEVLGLGNIYQGGYIFGIDDTTPSSSSISGTVMAQSDQSTGSTWNNGTFLVTSASSLTDGATNSSTILAAQGPGTYAAEACSGVVDGFNDWYLPSICQMDGGSSGASCPASIPNIQMNLVTPGTISATGVGAGALSSPGFYWSSTEYSANPSAYSWYEYFNSGGGNASLTGIKSTSIAVRCVRTLTQ